MGATAVPVGNRPPTLLRRQPGSRCRRTLPARQEWEHGDVRRGGHRAEQPGEPPLREDDAIEDVQVESHHEETIPIDDDVLHGLPVVDHLREGAEPHE